MALRYPRLCYSATLAWMLGCSIELLGRAYRLPYRLLSLVVPGLAGFSKTDTTHNKGAQGKSHHDGSIVRAVSSGI